MSDLSRRSPFDILQDQFNERYDALAKSHVSQETDMSKVLVADIGLSNRAENALLAEKIVTLRDLLVGLQYKNFLKRIPNIGPKSEKDIVECLYNIGISVPEFRTREFWACHIVGHEHNSYEEAADCVLSPPKYEWVTYPLPDSNADENARLAELAKKVVA